MTVLTILGIVRTVFQILNPQADLTLGGNVTATATLTGDTLGIDFQDMPGVRWQWFWFSGHPQVRRVELRPDGALVLFQGSRFLKSHQLRFD